MMKRISLIILLVGILPLNACAQWYLFPGKKKASPTKEVVEEATIIQNNTEPSDSLAIDDTSDLMDDWFSHKASQINIVLALPIEAKSDKPNSNFLEMYSGALMALDELSAKGTKYQLTVIDTKDVDANYSALDDANVILGPVSYNEIVRTLATYTGNQMIISPLDPKAAALSEDSNVLQSPVPQANQIEDMIKWLDEDLMPGDQLLVAKDMSNSGNKEQNAQIFSLLNQRAISYSIVNNFTDYPFEEGLTYRIVVASDNDAFHTGITRNIAIEAERNPKSNIILYCNSRIRSSISQNVSDLHKVRARMTAGYHIDYESPQVKDFILKYRALFNSEPGSFAFQGYDAVKYYASACDIYGLRWHNRLWEYSWRGLQSDFKFDKDVNNGRTNVAVRRVIYNKDFSISLQ